MSLTRNVMYVFKYPPSPSSTLLAWRKGINGLEDLFTTRTRTSAITTALFPMHVEEACLTHGDTYRIGGFRRSFRRSSFLVLLDLWPWLEKTKSLSLPSMKQRIKALSILSRMLLVGPEATHISTTVWNFQSSAVVVNTSCVTSKAMWLIPMYVHM
jgi:hypothetical protein